MRGLTLLGLAVCMATLLLLDVTLSRRPDSVKLSIADLTQPDGVPAPPPGTIPAENRRSEWVRIVRGLCDSSNPFGASESDLVQAREWLVEMRAAAHTMLWLEYRLLARVPERDAPGCLQFMTSHGQSPEVDDLALLSTLDARFGTAPHAVLAAPPEWAPQDEPGPRQEMWQVAFDQSNTGRPLLLGGANRRMVSWTAQQRRDGEKASEAQRLHQACLQLLDVGRKLDEHCANIRALLPRMPNFVPGEPIDTAGPDTSFLELYDAMGQAHP